eukprot:5203652-Ditylum_brightwellii.AAC.1
MPTMRSIGMHPPFRDKLANLGNNNYNDKSTPTTTTPTKATTTTTTTTTTTSQEIPHHPSTTTNETTNNNRIPPIHTPLALLSRDVNEIASNVKLPKEQVLNIRAAVSDALIVSGCGNDKDSDNSGVSSGATCGAGHGMKSLRIVATVSHALRSSTNADTTTKKKDSADGNYDDA